MNSDSGKMRGGRTGKDIKAVIFDCDGVILDSRDANIAFYNTILSHFNKTLLTEDQVSFIHCHTIHESLAMLFGEDGLLEEAQAFWTQMDYTPFVSLLSLHSGLMACLEVLHREYKTAIATSRTNTMGLVMEKFGLNDYFDMVVTSLDVQNPKPHPESLDKILSFLSISPREACYIGDSAVDQETARQAGVTFIAYRNEGLQADRYLNDFTELLPMLKQLSLPTDREGMK
jgi:HAD superfamily hydrolase (TIGR01509 family)